MISNTLLKRGFTTQTNNYQRVIKYTGKNINVASHNDERRQAYAGEFNFKDTWGMGVEGFSHGPHLQDMNPLTGSKSEFIWLAAILIALPLLARGRKNNEDGIADALGKSTNKYSKLNLDHSSANIQT